MLDAVERLVSNAENGQISSVTTIDLSKAFDSVDHDVLLTKLSWYGVLDVEWFRSYLDSRAQIVRGGQVTLPMTCAAGLDCRPELIFSFYERPVRTPDYGH